MSLELTQDFIAKLSYEIGRIRAFGYMSKMKTFVEIADKMSEVLKNEIDFQISQKDKWVEKEIAKHEKET